MEETFTISFEGPKLKYPQTISLLFNPSKFFRSCLLSYFSSLLSLRSSDSFGGSLLINVVINVMTLMWRRASAGSDYRKTRPLILFSSSRH